MLKHRTHGSTDGRDLTCTSMLAGSSNRCNSCFSWESCSTSFSWAARLWRSSSICLGQRKRQSDNHGHDTTITFSPLQTEHGSTQWVFSFWGHVTLWFFSLESHVCSAPAPNYLHKWLLLTAPPVSWASWSRPTNLYTIVYVTLEMRAQKLWFGGWLLLFHSRNNSQVMIM